jgi:curved DNA-binding protein CbpA
MSTVNLYDILRVPSDCSQEDIKKAHKKLAKKYYPDKPGGDSEMYQLVTDAYKILYDKKSRQEYDEIFALSKQSDADHYDLKAQSTSYLKSQKTENQTKSKAELQKDFHRAFEEMDRKHNFKRNDDAKKIDNNVADNMLKDLRLVRQQEDIENIHEELFDKSRLNIKKFNAAFDSLYKSHNELIPHQGNPDPWNATHGVDSNYSAIDSYETLYAEGDDKNFSTAYSNIKLEANNNKGKMDLTKEEIEDLPDAEYTDKHKAIEPDYEKTLEEKLKSREMDTEKFKKLDPNKDFINDPTCGGYGIFSGVKNLTDSNNLLLENKEDIKARYNKLLQLRSAEDGNNA